MRQQRFWHCQENGLSKAILMILTPDRHYMWISSWLPCTENYGLSRFILTHNHSIWLDTATYVGEYCWNRCDEPVLMAGQKPLQFGNHHSIWKLCGVHFLPYTPSNRLGLRRLRGPYGPEPHDQTGKKSRFISYHVKSIQVLNNYYLLYGYFSRRSFLF